MRRMLLGILAIITTACTPRNPETQTGDETSAAKTQITLPDFEINGTTLVRYTGNEISVVIPEELPISVIMHLWGNN